MSTNTAQLLLLGLQAPCSPNMVANSSL